MTLKTTPSALLINCLVSCPSHTTGSSLFGLISDDPGALIFDLKELVKDKDTPMALKKNIDLHEDDDAKGKEDVYEIIIFTREGMSWSGDGRLLAVSYTSSVTISEVMIS